MKIGITFTGDIEKHNSYKQWIEQQDDVETVLLQPGVDIKGIDGLVLSGGIDIDPVFYNGSTDYADKPNTGWQPERDEYELLALRYALDNKIPVVGICRGLQLINVFFQGALKQDLGESLNMLHRATKISDKDHDITIERDSLLGEITQQHSGHINSAHHQAIDKLGEGLAVNARSEEGIIEGIEWKEPSSKSFLLGVQWHPERMYINKFPDTSLYNAIRDRFIREVRHGHQKII
ncbi:MAG: gamma-glutamyl-gamma-aminobutyrate hydrolase family protein [Flavitalea sp.]